MSQKKTKSFFYRNPRITGVMVFVVIFMIAQSLTLQRYLLNLSESEKQNTEELTSVIDKLQHNLNYALSTTNTLAFIVEHYGVPRDYDSIAKKLLETNTLIDGIQLLQEGTITHTYPLEGNEVVIGYRVVEDPTRNKEVLMAAEKGQMYFAGPFELRQGGMGVVGRVPLMVENDSLAFAAVVIRLEKLLEMSGISDDNKRFLYQISKVNPQTEEMEYFLDTDADFSESEVATVEVPMGQWMVYVKEKNANYLKGILQLAILGLILSIVAGILTWFLVKRPAELENRISLQSRTILENQRRFRALVENSMDAVAIITPQGANKYVSPSVTAVLGYTVEEIMNINLFDILHEDDKPFVAEEMQFVLQNPGKTILGHISRIKHKDGSWRWIESSIKNLLDDPAVNGIVDNFRDITERKEAQDQLIKEKKLSEAVIDSLPGIFYMFNQDGKFLLWNKNFETLSEYSENEIKKMHPTDFFEGEDRVHIEERVLQTFETGESSAEAYFTSKTGKKIYHYFTGALIDYKGETCLLGTGIDTSKRKKAEEELEKSEEQLLSIFNNSISAVILMDAKGAITNWNATAEQIFGWKYEEVLNKPMHHFIMPEKYVGQHLKGMETYKKTGKGLVINANTELKAITKSKKEIDILLGVTTVKIRGKEYFIGFVNDITQQKEIERHKEYEKRNKEALINNTDDMIWSVDKNLKLIAANTSFLRSFKDTMGIEIRQGEKVIPENIEGMEEYFKYWNDIYARGFKGESFTIEGMVPKNEDTGQEEVYFEATINPIFDNKIVEGIACYARDVSQKIKIEKEIKEYNNKLKTAQEIAQLGYWEHTYGDEALYWSDQIYRIWELDKEEYTPTTNSFFEAVVPADRTKFNLYANRPIDNFQEQDIEYRIITATGKLKWIHQFGQKEEDKENNRIIFKGTIRDITEQKKQEEAIIEFNEKLQTAQKIAKLGYWEFDLKNEKLTWSDQVYEIWEKSKKTFNVTLDSFYKSLHPDDIENFLSEQSKALEGKKTLEKEHRIVLDNGKIKWVMERGKLIYDDDGNPLIFEGTVQDISSQKLIEMELREQNYFIKTAIDNLPVGIAVRNIHTGIFTLMNKNFTEIYGWSKSEFRDVDSFFDKVYPDSAYRNKIKKQIFSDLASKNLKRMQWEGLHITTKNGDKRIINARNIPLYDQDLMISTVLDVTEKAFAEQRLAISNERYEYVTKATFDAIWDWEFKNNNMYWGEGFKTIFGHKVENTSPEFWYSNIHPDDYERIKKSIENTIENNGRNWENEYRFKHANGTYRFVKDRGILLRNVERKALRMIGAMQDITSQKEYEMKLLDVNQKLRNLSAHLQEAREEERISIAREIHDELGQQLTGIKLDVSWLKNKVDTKFPDDRERTVRLIDNINKTINDVRKIASHLRPGVLDDLGLEAAIEWQTHQFQTQTGINCILHFENVSGNYGKEINTAIYRIYQEALTNVMRHAKATEVKTIFMEHDHTLTLEVTDNGIGIDDAEKNNTFSLGITGMRERAVMINADFFVKKQKDGGTKVKVSVNLNS